MRFYFIKRDIYYPGKRYENLYNEQGQKTDLVKSSEHKRLSSLMTNVGSYETLNQLKKDQKFRKFTKNCQSALKLPKYLKMK